MIVPVGVFVKDNRGNILEDRSEYYLIDQFNRAYGRRLEKLKDWSEWTRLIRIVSAKCREAFDGTSNLHESTRLIGELRSVYEHLREEIAG